MKKRTNKINKLIVIGLIGLWFSTGISSISACETELFAGRDLTIAGNVRVWTSGELLFIRYSTDSGWEIYETHLAIATSLSEIPQTKSGNPKIGRFPLKSNHPEGTEGVTYVVNIYDYLPVGDLSGKTLVIAAHAVVGHPDFGRETAWADTWGQSFQGNSWALYFNITF